MMVDRPEVFRSLYLKHRPWPTHPGAETLVTELSKGLDERAIGVRSLMDKVWNEREFLSGAYTFDPRWYNALPIRRGREPDTRTRRGRVPARSENHGQQNTPGCCHFRGSHRRKHVPPGDPFPDRSP